jgi:HD superfamily phosphohydrolase
MTLALAELSSKGIDITEEEKTSAKIAILLHDIGHGPFSHALEHVLIEHMHHEELSLMLMKKLDKEFNGALKMAIDIFTHRYPKKFLHQLVSGQLDVDRMDYLTRDSFFTGVSEGVIGYDRIIKMLTVHEGELMVEEKAIYSIEKFLVARRLMYWQVYLHKTVLSAEMMLVRILERVKELWQRGDQSVLTNGPLTLFLTGSVSGNMEENMELFTLLDDTDVVASLKHWSGNEDTLLAFLCRSVLNRKLLKVKLQAEPISEELLLEKKRVSAEKAGVNINDSGYLAFTGEAVNRLYNPYDEHINILFKDGSVRNISEVDNALIHENLSRPVKKFYICFVG